jgi:Domain of unknown function (DUF4126)
VGDKIPAVDHVLHAVGADILTLLSVLLGAGTAGTVHTGRAAVRPASTATAAGVGNQVLSLLEDAASFALTIAAFVILVIAFAVALGLVMTILLAWRRLRRGRAAPSPAG